MQFYTVVGCELKARGGGAVYCVVVGRRLVSNNVYLAD
jgi:hypothetical protein